MLTTIHLLPVGEKLNLKPYNIDAFCMDKDDKSKLKRSNRKAILFNSRELEAIEQYCQRFRVKNQSKFMREAIIRHVLKEFDNFYPSLFEDQQMQLF